MAKTATAPKPKVESPFEPIIPPPAKPNSFAAMSTELAAADIEARAASSDAGQARAKRSTVAVGTIKAAHLEKVVGADVRSVLLDAGVLKGTVSKIVTVLEALYAGHLSPNDVKSLNGAYNLVKSVHAAHAAAGGAPVTSGAIFPPVTPVTTPAPAKVTPDEALKIIIDSILAEKNADKQFKLGGDWITKCTNAITDALKESEGDEGE